MIFDFGKTFASTEAARRLAEVAQEDVELQRQARHASTVKQTFIHINFAQRLIRVQEQSLERADLNLRSARGFFEVGTRPKSDVARAEVDVANARVDLIRARNAERVARVALNTAMGIAVDTPTQVQDNLFYQKMQLDRPAASGPGAGPAAGVQAGPSARGRGRGPAAAGQSATSSPTSPGPAPTAASATISTRSGRSAWRSTWTHLRRRQLIAQVREKRALVDVGQGPGQGDRARHRPGSRAGRTWS